jgi:hypothetical protein
MNKREYIERLLALCPESYNDIFNRMYPDGLESKQIKWATTQVENSVKGLSRSVERNTEATEHYSQQLMDNEKLLSEYVSKIASLAADLKMSERKVEHLLTDPEAVATAEVQERLDLLEALENGGVDNWEWYSESIADYEKSN